MYKSSQLRKIVDSIGSEITIEEYPVNQMESYLLSYKIQTRPEFSNYLFDLGVSSPKTVIKKYIQSLGAPEISLLSASNIKEVLFNNLNRNKHKEGMLSGVAQAYFDLCLFLGLSSICIDQSKLRYEEIVESVKKSLYVLEEKYSDVCSRLKPFYWSGGLEDFQYLAEGLIDFNKLQEMLTQSVQIIYLYLNNKVKYDESYRYLINLPVKDSSAIKLELLSIDC